MKNQTKKRKLLWKGTIGEAVKQGRVTQKEADDMISCRTYEEQEIYDEGFEQGKAQALKQVLEIIDSWDKEHNYYVNPKDIKELKAQLEKLK